uniref:Uncharacterized protein n=1 Tax=Anguilla anguilla TaxID=7936 RepID=A0A0E9QPL9_ANGAN
MLLYRVTYTLHFDFRG